jgi:CheY-like chemotaxis protein
MALAPVGEQLEQGREQMSRVLVVEDNADLRTLLDEVLTDAGFEVRTVANGDEALAVADTWRPSAIVLDLMMPVMDGPTFLRRRRSTPSLQSVPVLVLTAHPGHQRVLEGLDVTVVLRKPYDLYELIDAVGALCAGDTGRGQVG